MNDDERRLISSLELGVEPRLSCARRRLPGDPSDRCRFVANWAASIRLPLAAEGRQPDDGGVSEAIDHRTPAGRSLGVCVTGGLGVSGAERSTNSRPSAAGVTKRECLARD
jgi:hypothetical protein